MGGFPQLFSFLCSSDYPHGVVGKVLYYDIAVGKFEFVKGMNPLILLVMG